MNVQYPNVDTFYMGRYPLLSYKTRGNTISSRNARTPEQITSRLQYLFIHRIAVSIKLLTFLE